MKIKCERVLIVYATVGKRANRQMMERYVQRQGYPKEDAQELKFF
jgi:hypothetical protein